MPLQETDCFHCCRLHNQDNEKTSLSSDYFTIIRKSEMLQQTAPANFFVCLRELAFCQSVRKTKQSASDNAIQPEYAVSLTIALQKSSLYRLHLISESARIKEL